MPNSVGNTNKDIRKFCREVGVKPTVANVEKMQREVTRTQTENERLVRHHKEMERERGLPSVVDNRGDVAARVRARVQRDLKNRGR